MRNKKANFSLPTNQGLSELWCDLNAYLNAKQTEDRLQRQRPETTEIWHSTVWQQTVVSENVSNVAILDLNQTEFTGLSDVQQSLSATYRRRFQFLSMKHTVLSSLEIVNMDCKMRMLGENVFTMTRLLVGSWREKPNFTSTLMSRFAGIYPGLRRKFEIVTLKKLN